MKSFKYISPENYELTTSPIPKIENDTDVIVKVTIASLCTSDIHIIKGKVPRAKEGTILGHEGVGIVIEIGKKIKKVKINDHVVINCISFCGECYYCKHGYINNCEKGGWEVGCRINGTLAEYVRIPYGDTSLNIIPNNLNDIDALLVGDVLSSGYFGCDLCEVKENDIVAIIGAGPVGICSMLCCRMRKAKIIAIDIKDECLDFVQKNNLADYLFNPNKVNIVNEILNITDNRGADCVIEDAGGDNTFEMAWKIARANAIVGLVGMYESNQVFPLPLMYGKNLIFKTGGVDAVHCDQLLKMIELKLLNTNMLITHKMPFSQVKEAFELFRNKPEFCIKIAITVD